MLSHSSPSTIRNLLKGLLPMTVAVLFVVSVQASRTLVGENSPLGPTEASIAHPDSFESPQATRLQSELITLRPSGFEPAQITRPAGPFVLAVNNRTGVEDLTLRLEREHGTREREVRLSSRKPRARERLNLAPGTYLLTVTGHPEWVCRIRTGN